MWDGGDLDEVKTVCGRKIQVKAGRGSLLHLATGRQPKTE